MIQKWNAELSGISSDVVKRATYVAQLVCTTIENALETNGTYSIIVGNVPLRHLSNDSLIAC